MNVLRNIEPAKIEVETKKGVNVKIGLFASTNRRLRESTSELSRLGSHPTEAFLCQTVKSPPKKQR